MTARERERQALEQMRLAPESVVRAVCDVVRARLEQTHEELESLTETAGMYRAQGRAQLARELLRDLGQNRRQERV